MQLYIMMLICNANLPLDIRRFYSLRSCKLNKMLVQKQLDSTIFS